MKEKNEMAEAEYEAWIAEGAPYCLFHKVAYRKREGCPDCRLGKRGRDVPTQKPLVDYVEE